MADLVITAANVLQVANARINNGYNAGVAITQGQGVYLKSSDSTWRLAQCDTTLEESGSGVTKGIALNAAAPGQPLSVLESGDITIGATVVTGTQYFVSANAGNICVAGDLVSTNYVTAWGFAISTTVIRLAPNATGIQKP